MLGELIIGKETAINCYCGWASEILHQLIDALFHYIYLFIVNNGYLYLFQILVFPWLLIAGLYFNHSELVQDFATAHPQDRSSVAFCRMMRDDQAACFAGGIRIPRQC